MARIPGSAALALLLSLVPAGLGAQDPPKAVVLTYHIVQSPNDTVYSMTREAFRRQMEYLRATGYTVISLADLHDYVTGRRESIPDPSVVVTVDDGWKCVYTEIFPVMKELGFPFTVFVYPKFIGQSAYALSWKDVRDMAEAGVDIQSHSYSHSYLTRRSIAGLKMELVESKRTIEKKTGKPVRFIAYPYGDYNARVMKATEAAGYEAGLTCNFGPVARGSNPFEMKRVVLYEKTSFAEFRRQLGTEQLQLARVSPEAGGRFDPEEPVVAATIAGFQELVPESVNLSILGLRRAPSSYDPRDGSISLVLKDAVAGRKYSAAVWGIDRRTGKRRDAVWTFTLPTAEAAIVAARRPALPSSGAGAVTAASMSGQR
ncbi:MAG TPA: polysaccharide deacetylase family protein [Thermoanaerobaculia bacterium]